MLLLCVHLATTTAELGLLVNYYTDHLRHMRYVQEFFRLGFGIYGTTPAQMEAYGDPRAYIWPQGDYVYPPGALLLHLPFSLLLYQGHVSLEAVSRLYLMTLLLVHHCSCWLLLKRLRGALALLFLGLVYFFGVFWSLHGPFDVVPLLFVVLACGWPPDSSRRASLLAWAPLFKFQFLLVVPFLLRWGWNHGWARLRRLPGVWSLGLTAISLFLIRHGLDPTRANPLGWEKVGLGDVEALLCLVATLLFVSDLLLRKRRFAAGTLALTYGAYASLPLLQSWHLTSLFILPLAADPDDQEPLMLYALLLFWLADQLSEPYKLLLLIESSH